MKKAKDSKPGSLASSLKSDSEMRETTDQDLVIDSGSTDHVIVQRSWFKNLRELDTSVTNPDGGNTKVLGIGEVEILAGDAQGRKKRLLLRKSLFVPAYGTNILSV